MPYPAQTTRQQIIQQAWEMVAANGAESLSLHKLAAALGVKAPSLYRHVKNKADVLQAVNLLTLRQLFDVMAQAQTAAPTEPTDRMMALLAAYRAFAHAHPHVYAFAFGDNDAYRPEENVLLRMVLPIQAVMAEICGEADSLSALRGALALAHGFVMLELNNQLRRGGDLGEAFTQSAAAYLRGWQV
ncbi:MAG: TetR/AcrR family transcriptional regulator [Chloroflexi bacterium]|nr:TetR/AcrR family transcriptional regulator [Chloroflexota bacterium]